VDGVDLMEWGQERGDVADERELVPTERAVFSLAVGRKGLNVARRPALAFLNAGLFLSRIYGQYSVGGRAVG
jgi:hypothetical protein